MATTCGCILFQVAAPVLTHQRRPTKGFPTWEGARMAVFCSQSALRCAPRVFCWDDARVSALALRERRAVRFE